MTITTERTDDILVNKQYGKWNAILAIEEKKRCVFYQNHAKVFPEQLSDWINALKNTIIQGILTPVRLDIDITNACPHDCVMCFSRELRKNNTFIPINKLKDIFNNFKKLGGKSVRLTGGGEPLSHPNIADIIQYLASLNLKITIETNGDLITPVLADLVAKYVHHFRISVDAANNNSRESVHKPNAASFTYDSLLEKIKMVRAKSLEQGRGDSLFLGATFVILPENYQVISKFVSDMYDIGINWVALRKNIYREIYDQNPDILPFVEKEIGLLKKTFGEKTKNFTIEEQYGVSFHPKEDFHECWVSYIRPIVLADSSLQLCCLARNGIIPEADIGILPNTTMPIDDLLRNNNSSIQQFRQVVPKTCKVCIDKDNNISFSNVVALLKKNSGTKFLKAHVFLKGAEEKTDESSEIVQVPLNEMQYEHFKNGTIVKL